MNPNKSELKQLILRELGTKFDDQREALSDTVQQVKGAKVALLKSVKDIQALSKVAEKELEEGKIPDLQVLELVKLYVTRAMDSLTLKARQLGQEALRHQGRLEQADSQIKYLEKLFMTEEKLQADFQKALANGDILDDGGEFVVTGSPAAPDNIMPIRPDGVRPGASIAQQRKAEEAAEAAVAVAEAKAKAKPKKKRKSRKTKGNSKASGSSVDVAPDAG
jgi:hypothetical protein